MDKPKTITPTKAIITISVVTIVFLLAFCQSQSYAAPVDEDNYEPNDSLSTATDISNIIDKSLDATLFLESGDPDHDWYVFLVGEDHEYEVTVIAWPGLTLTMTLYGPAGNEIISEQTTSGTLTFEFDSSVQAYYAVQIFAEDDSTGNYQFEVSDVTVQEEEAQATETPEEEGEEETAPPTPAAPIPTPDLGMAPDFAEPNYMPGLSYRITLNDVLRGLNFNSGDSGQIDNDWYVLPVVENITYTCETFDLGQASDTNLIIFGSAEWGHPFPEPKPLIGGNDDIDTQAGRIESRVSWTSGYSGDAYLLVGYKFPRDVDLRRPGNSAYSLTCYAGQSEETIAAAEAAAPAGGGGGSMGGTAPDSLPLAANDIRLVRQPDLPALAPVLEAQATLIPILIGYDLNGDGRVNPSEGASSVSVRVYNARTNEEMDHALTQNGSIQFVFASADTLRVEIPLLGLSLDIEPGNTETQEIVLPAVLVPPVLP